MVYIRGLHTFQTKGQFIVLQGGLWPAEVEMFLASVGVNIATFGGGEE